MNNAPDRHLSSQALDAAREGRMARSRGLSRDLNPYRRASGPDEVDPSMSATLRRQRAWWRGWDEADAELGGVRS
jgi:hypothetical protein